MRWMILVLLVCALGPACGPRAHEIEGGRKLVTLWAHEGQPAEKQALQELVDGFNMRQTNIRAQLSFKQEQGYGDRVNAAAIAGQLPDLLEVDGPYTAHFAALGILRPLGDLAPEGYLKDFLPTVIAQGAYQDELYTLGAFESTVVLFYDRARLEACGIRPPAEPAEAWNWQTFTAALENIRRRFPNLLPLETFLTWGGEWLPYAFMPLIWSNNGRVLAPDGRRASGFINGPAAVEALQAWQQLFQRGLADPNAAPGKFERGEAAMALGVFNRWPIYRAAGIDFGMSPYPGLRKSVSPSGSWCWGIAAACRNPEAAATVMQALLDPRTGIPPVCRANGGIPARLDALAEMPDYQASRGLFVAQLRQTARARPVTPAYATLSMELSRALGDIARGADVQGALDAAARRIDPVLDE